MGKSFYSYAINQSASKLLIVTVHKSILFAEVDHIQQFFSHVGTISEDKVSCSRVQHHAYGEAQTSNTTPQSRVRHSTSATELLCSLFRI